MTAEGDRESRQGTFASVRSFFHRCQECNKRIKTGSFCSAACEARAIDELAYGA